MQLQHIDAGAGGRRGGQGEAPPPGPSATHRRGRRAGTVGLQVTVRHPPSWRKPDPATRNATGSSLVRREPGSRSRRPASAPCRQVQDIGPAFADADLQHRRQAWMLQSRARRTACCQRAASLSSAAGPGASPEHLARQVLAPIERPPGHAGLAAAQQRPQFERSDGAAAPRPQRRRGTMRRRREGHGNSRRGRAIGRRRH